MNTDSRYDSYAAHAARVRRHGHTCRDGSCEWEQDAAEDAKWEREGIA